MHVTWTCRWMVSGTHTRHTHCGAQAAAQPPHPPHTAGAGVARHSQCPTVSQIVRVSLTGTIRQTVRVYCRISQCGTITVYCFGTVW
jgi:hypothetical protein